MQQGNTSPIIPSILRLSLPHSKTACKTNFYKRIKEDASNNSSKFTRYDRMHAIDPKAPSHDYRELTATLTQHQSSILMQLHTGHAQLHRHLYNISATATPICPACNRQEETVRHYLLSCMAHAQHCPIVTHNTPLVITPHMAFLVGRKDLTWSLSNMLRIMPTPILLFPRLPSSCLFSWDVSPDWDLPSPRANAQLLYQRSLSSYNDVLSNMSIASMDINGYKKKKTSSSDIVRAFITDSYDGSSEAKMMSRNSVSVIVTSISMSQANRSWTLSRCFLRSSSLEHLML